MSNMNFAKILILGLAAFIVVFGAFGVASAKAVSMSLPTTGSSGSSPCVDGVTSGNSGTPCTPSNYINTFYQFALFLSGIIAFGAIVFGGVKYMTSAGNPSAQSEGKEWIYSALLGLALLAGAYLILNTVNPQLTNLTLPTLPQTNPSQAPTGGS